MAPTPWTGRADVRRGAIGLIAVVAIAGAATTALAAGGTQPPLELDGLRAGARVSAPVVVTASSPPHRVLAKVTYRLDGTVVATRSSAPFRWVLSTRRLALGPHTAVAVGVDGSGRVVRTVRPFTVVATPGVPALRLLGPSDGATLSEAVRITASVADPSRTAQVRFYLGSSLVATDVSPPYTWTFTPAMLVRGGRARMRVVAIDSRGHRTGAVRSYVVVPPADDAPEEPTEAPAPDDEGGSEFDPLGLGEGFSELAWRQVPGLGPISALAHRPFDHHQIVAPDRLVAVDSPNLVPGRYVARFQVKDGDKGGGSSSGERNELMQGGSRAPTEREGTSAFYAIGMYFPSDFAAPSWTIMHQMHGTYPGSSPVVAIEADNGSELQIVRRGGSPNAPTQARHVIESSLTRNVWHEFVYYVHWAADDSGVLKVWHRRAGIDPDWRLVVDDRGPVGYKGSGRWWTPYPKLGIYRSSSVSGTTTVYHAGIRLRAPSFGDAAGLFG